MDYKHKFQNELNNLEIFKQEFEKTIANLKKRSYSTKIQNQTEDVWKRSRDILKKVKLHLSKIPNPESYMISFYSRLLDDYRVFWEVCEDYNITEISDEDYKLLDLNHKHARLLDSNNIINSDTYIINNYDGSTVDSGSFLVQEQEEQAEFIKFEPLRETLDQQYVKNEKSKEMLKKVTDLNEMMCDLNAVVNNQTKEVEELDQNVEEVRTNVRAGLKDVAKASKYQKGMTGMAVAGSAICAIVGGPVALGVGLGLKAAIGVATGSGIVGFFGGRSVSNALNSNADSVLAEIEQEEELEKLRKKRKEEETRI